ncbi:MAG TPA: FAD:protein FMN transferase [Streptosporangiaceae bacterium]|nr:FAD:protein FMN transferase [Streptosporangiaceae bacterium]
MTTADIARDTFDVFGTTAVLLVTVPRAAARARGIADDELASVDLACSRFRPDSELAALNEAAGRGPQPISPLFADLLAAALRAARLTGGDVDPTCGRALVGLGYDRDFAQVRAAGDAPPRLTGPVGPVPGWRRVHLDRVGRRAWIERGVQVDLGATAKAWAADRCAEVIAREADCGVLISLGGDIAVAGPPPEDGWRIRVTDDHAAPPTAPGQTVTISTGGLATSSTTVRAWKVGGRPVHHIIDPATGEPARSCWRTVSVAAGSCTDANTASTAAIIRGPAAIDWLHDIGLPARLVRHDGTVETTAGWPRDDGPGEAA